ncbi:hypothetical protein [Myroides odoratus]|uniref:hypothetical protein n=1 Tax=Myroides odoratus TaxID=256 RepID=UPI000B29E1B4|nr:hypothetical protein [Myroides odoratus]
MKNGPNYNNIYRDLIEKQFPERVEEFSSLLSVDITNSIQVIELNNLLFYQFDNIKEWNNQKFKSYDLISVMKILKFQEENSLSNVDVSNFFRISRNTLASWKKKRKMFNI